MACRLIGAKPLSEPMLDYCQLDPCEHIQWKFNQNTTTFFEENARENVVCEMASILSRPQCVNMYFEETWKHHCILLSYLYIKVMQAKSLKTFLREEKEIMCILSIHVQYCGCWWPGILAAPGYQQPWYWPSLLRIHGLCTTGIYKGFTQFTKDLHRVSVGKGCGLSWYL